MYHLPLGFAAIDRKHFGEMNEKKWVISTSLLYKEFEKHRGSIRTENEISIVLSGRLIRFNVQNEMNKNKLIDFWLARSSMQF